jgi:NitT/TauT family transport system substrate-binding protein
MTPRYVEAVNNETRKNHTVRHLISRLFFGLIASAIGVATVHADPEKADPEKIVYASPGTLSATMSPFIFAQQVGFFRDENLDLDVVALQGSGEIIPQLVKGTVGASMLTPDLLIVSREPGRPNFPIHFVYNVYRHSIWQMAVLDANPIQTFHDLGGKIIGVGALTFANVLQTKALLRRNDVDPASANFVAVGNGVGAIEMLRSGKIDALNLFASTDAVVEAQGIKIRRIAYPSEFANTSSHGLVFADKTIAEHPDLVVRFGRAVAKGTIGCQANISGCLDAFWKVYPDQRPRPTTDAVHKREEAILKVTVDAMVAFDSEPKLYGSYSDADWTPTVNSLRLGGQISQDTKIDLSSLYTNAFVDDYNKFDRAAVIAKAKAYQP